MNEYRLNNKYKNKKKEVIFNNKIDRKFRKGIECKRKFKYKSKL